MTIQWNLFYTSLINKMTDVADFSKLSQHSSKQFVLTAKCTLRKAELRQTKLNFRSPRKAVLWGTEWIRRKKVSTLSKYKSCKFRFQQEFLRFKPRWRELELLGSCRTGNLLLCNTFRENYDGLDDRKTELLIQLFRKEKKSSLFCFAFFFKFCLIRNLTDKGFSLARLKTNKQTRNLYLEKLFVS